MKRPVRLVATARRRMSVSPPPSSIYAQRGREAPWPPPAGPFRRRSQETRLRNSGAATKLLRRLYWQPPMCCSAWMAAVLFLVLGFGEATAGDVEAIAPGGPGVLTKCRGWLVTTSCKTYHHISLPHRIAVGDSITLHFGSSPKFYAFPVARIYLQDRHCEIFSQAKGNKHQMDKINVAQCHQLENSEGNR
jgi:hypothetical protein